MPAVWFLSPHHFHHRYLAKFPPLLIIDGVWLSGLKEAILRRLFAFLTDPTLKIINHSFIIVVVIIVVIINIMRLSSDSYMVLSSVILGHYVRSCDETIPEALPKI